MVSVRTVVMLLVTFSYLISVRSVRARELRTSSWCPEVGLGILFLTLRMITMPSRWSRVMTFTLDVLGVQRLV